MAEHSERRRASRVDASLNLQVKVPRADGSVETASLETINISTSGIYFKSDHFVEPMTKLGMEIEVAVPCDDFGDDVETAVIVCEGLVVRTDPEGPVDGCTEYEVAVFFTHIKPDGMTTLEKHIALLIDDKD